jgi:hypothetical protein
MLDEIIRSNGTPSFGGIDALTSFYQTPRDATLLLENTDFVRLLHRPAGRTIHGQEHERSRPRLADLLIISQYKTC